MNRKYKKKLMVNVDNAFLVNYFSHIYAVELERQLSVESTPLHLPQVIIRKLLFSGSIILFFFIIIIYRVHCTNVVPQSKLFVFLIFIEFKQQTKKGAELHLPVIIRKETFLLPHLPATSNKKRKILSDLICLFNPLYRWLSRFLLNWQSPKQINAPLH